MKTWQRISLANCSTSAIPSLTHAKRKTDLAERLGPLPHSSLPQKEQGLEVRSRAQRQAGCGDSHLHSQHLGGGRGREIAAK